VSANGEWGSWSNHVLSELKRLDSGVSKANDTLEEHKTSLEAINQTLIRNTVSLEEHVKRTNLLERKFEHIDTEVDGLKDHLKEIKWMTSGVFKFMILVAGIASFVGTLITILDKFK
jgi:uncharacterized protein YwgA